MYATEAGSKQKVQTPVQSQNKSDVAPHPVQPEAESSRAQTPVQTQDPSTIIPIPQHTRPRISNAGPIYTFWGLLFATPIISYYYYQYRKDHMDKKRERLIAEAQEKYKPRG